jgi:hypothetical protein
MSPSIARRYSAPGRTRPALVLACAPALSRHGQHLDATRRVAASGSCVREMSGLPVIIGGDMVRLVRSHAELAA